MAWAVLQTPFWSIDCAFHPAMERELYRQVLAWAEYRAREIIHTPYGHPAWFVSVSNERQDQIADLVTAGFADQHDVGENSWSKVLLRRPSEIAIASNPLPPGFGIRTLTVQKPADHPDAPRIEGDRLVSEQRVEGDRPGSDLSDVEAYVELHRAAFESRNMTLEWRMRAMGQPEYLPELDLMVTAPDGRPVAFCVGWLDRAYGADGQSVGQIEPMGVHPDFRSHGLGRAVLAETLRRLTALGAAHVIVETDNQRGPALELYLRSGFRVIQDVRVYRKDFLPVAAADCSAENDDHGT